MVDLRDPNVVQTEKMCMEAVRQDGCALRYVKNQTEDICIEAVKRNGLAVRYVKNQTEDICIEAVKQNGYAVRYVKNQTNTICLYAVNEHGLALEYVKNQTDVICMEAVKEKGSALRYVRNQTEAICMEAVKHNWCALEYVHNQTDAICLEAIDNYFKQDLFYTVQDVCDKIKYPSPQLIIHLLKLYPLRIVLTLDCYAKNIMTTYKTGSDVIVAHLVPHANDLLYRPNSANALVSHARWYVANGRAKIVFLTKS